MSRFLNHYSWSVSDVIRTTRKSIRPITFTIRYATIAPIEKRQYLQCWCEETNDDIPPLNHNWSLRLDRIPEAAITIIKGKWRKELETMPVTLQLSDRYKS